MQILLHEGTSSVFGGAKNTRLINGDLFFQMESSDRLHTIISWAGYELYVAVTCRCGGGRGMIDHSVLSVTAFWVSNVKYSHAVLEGAWWRIAVPLLYAVTYRNSLAAHSDVSRFLYYTQWIIAIP